MKLRTPQSRLIQLVNESHLIPLHLLLPCEIHDNIRPAALDVDDQRAAGLRGVQLLAVQEQGVAQVRDRR